MIDNGIDFLHLSENICQSIPIYPIILPSVIISLTCIGNDFISNNLTNSHLTKIKKTCLTHVPFNEHFICLKMSINSNILN